MTEFAKSVPAIKPGEDRVLFWLRFYPDRDGWPECFRCGKTVVGIEAPHEWAIRYSGDDDMSSGPACEACIADQCPELAVARDAANEALRRAQ
jgi:hypothetical protein